LGITAATTRSIGPFQSLHGLQHLIVAIPGSVSGFGVSRFLLSRTPYLPNPRFAMSSFHTRALLSLTPDAYDHASTTGVLPSYQAFSFQFPDEPFWLDHGPYDRYHVPSTIPSIRVSRFAMSTSTHPSDSRFPETRWLMAVDLSTVRSLSRKPTTCPP
jgi:hypothetical protein